MAALKVRPDPRPRIWLDPIPRLTWEYERTGRFSWSGDWGPRTGGGLSLRHEFGYRAFTERGIRRKMARMIRKERRRRFQKYLTRNQSGQTSGGMG